MADMFALTNTGLSNFLFSRVGEELNGSDLTILSMLARLGKDPWAVAAVWAQAPKALAIDELADNIAQTPLRRPASQSARQTASHLVSLLPNRSGQIRSGQGTGSKPPRWHFLLCAAVGLILSFAVSWVLHAGQLLATSTEPQVAHQLKQDR